MALILVVAGLVLAFAGRRLVWLLIGAAGFLAAFWLVGLLIPEGGLIVFLLAVAAGIAGSFLLRGLTRMAVSIAGFVFVGTAAVGLASSYGVGPWSLAWIAVFAVGGVVGLLLALFVAEIGLVLITALGGAAMVTMAAPELGLPMSGTVAGLVGPAVFVLGAVVQILARRD
jgi:hypothetical protein